MHIHLNNVTICTKMESIQIVYQYEIGETGKTNKNVNDFLSYFSKSIYIF